MRVDSSIHRHELAEFAPWVDQQLKDLELDTEGEDEAHSMSEWVQIIETSHSDLWLAIDAQG